MLTFAIFALGVACGASALAGLVALLDIVDGGHDRSAQEKAEEAQQLWCDAERRRNYSDRLDRLSPEQKADLYRAALADAAACLPEGWYTETDPDNKAIHFIRSATRRAPPPEH
jgi:hypothetical protein